MATVWIGTVRGALGFRQLVAIKKPHPHLLQDPGFRGELIAEARLASMIRHANVVDVRDVEIDGESLSLIMDYIEGASLGELLVAASKKSIRIPARVAVRIVRDACAGLHAAHELVDERDRPVGLVHRDVSPQNVLVGTDGISRVTDFGVAKFSRKNMQSTSEGSLKGKLAYMAPEYVRGEEIDRRFDVFALGIVLWEALTGKRCFRGENEAETLKRLLDWVPDPVSSVSRDLEPLDSIISCALAKDRNERFQNAAAMGAALEGAATTANLMGTHTEVAAVLKELAGAAIEERRALVRAKLANEPSVASLMGHPPIEALGSLPAPTRIEGPAPGKSEAAATPKMGGGGDATVTTTAVDPKMGAGAASAIPSTQPMTPPLNGAVPNTLPNTLMDPNPGPTLASAPPLQGTPAGGVPAIHTLASPMITAASPQMTAAPAGNTLRSEDDGPHVAPAALVMPPQQQQYQVQHQQQQPPMMMSDAPPPASAYPVDQPPTRSLAPIFIGAVVVIALAGALIWFTKFRHPSSEEMTTSSTAASATSSATTATAATTATPEASSSATPVVAPSAKPAVPNGKPTPTPRGGAKPSVPAHPTASAAPLPPPTPPTPTPTATTKTPPDNPYK